MSSTNITERKRLCDLIVGEREERRIWVEENFGDKDADEFGWVHNEQFDKVKEVTSPKRADPDCHQPVFIFHRVPFALAYPTAKDSVARIKADVEDTDDDDDDDLPRQWRPRQWSNVENWNTDENKYGNLKSCAVLALDDYNQQEGTNYEFIEIQKVGWQPVSGTKYEIFFQARKSAGAMNSEDVDPFAAHVVNRITMDGCINKVVAVRKKKDGCTWLSGTLTQPTNYPRPRR
ncbi:hypothetical protein LIER_24740 [Lithospermum erythrorhizon]|uniref:Cystatin domain-containing protein n=1 Tax=Lithospermum erythrorhizon TaxID=34254 RepID=A0AAV3R251_LITER